MNDEAVLKRDNKALEGDGKVLKWYALKCVKMQWGGV